MNTEVFFSCFSVEIDGLLRNLNYKFTPSGLQYGANKEMRCLSVWTSILLGCQRCDDASMAFKLSREMVRPILNDSNDWHHIIHVHESTVKSGVGKKPRIILEYRLMMNQNMILFRVITLVF